MTYKVDWTMHSAGASAIGSATGTMDSMLGDINKQTNALCTGAEIEMVTPGGEIAFVSRMIEESLQLRDRVQWYTTMLGKLSSVSVVVKKLLSLGNTNYALTTFVQGTKTRRWAQSTDATARGHRKCDETVGSQIIPAPSPP